MPYSFTVQKPTIAEALISVKEELDKVVAINPEHAHDAELAMKKAESMAGMLVMDDDNRVQISIEGGPVDGNNPNTVGVMISLIPRSMW